MYTRPFQIVDLIKTYQHGTQYADIYNTEEDARAKGYFKTCDKDQYGYTVWEIHPENKKYYMQNLAIVLPIRA